MPSMDRRVRLRRVGLLCIHFTRNLAFFRALSDTKPDRTEGDFWITIKGNCLDVAVLEWCKLFGDRGGKHGWQNICEDKDLFKTKLLANLGISSDDWDDCWEKLRSYRDAFVAHLDDELTMQIPNMQLPQQMVAFYYNYVIGLDEGTFFHSFLADLYVYYDACYAKVLDDASQSERLI